MFPLLNSGEAINVITFEYIPLFCIPLPQKYNPVIVTPIRNSRIAVSVELIREEGLELSGIDNVLERYILSFYQFIYDELGFDHGFRIRSEGSTLYKGFTYVAITNSMAKLLAGRLTNEVYEFLNMIDNRFGIPQCITALRVYERIGEAYIWRYGDDAVNMGRFDVFVKGSSSISDSVHRNPIIDDAQINNILTRLIGLVIIGIYNTIGSHDINLLNNYINVFNKIWESIYVFKECPCNKFMPNHTYLYVQDIDEVLALEIELHI